MKSPIAIFSSSVRSLKRLSLTGATLLLAGSLHADETLVFPDGPKVGDKAPALHLAKLLNAPTNASTSWESFKGKVVVLDFWATWCPPCVGSIPHMNSLVDALKNEPVQFIAITAEPESVITSFLKKNPMEGVDTEKMSKGEKAYGERLTKLFQQSNPIHAWIGLDDLTGQDPGSYYSGATITGYFFQGVPHCVVVDTNGIIAAYLHPQQVSAKYLRALAAGEHPAIPGSNKKVPEKQCWTEMGPEMEASIQRTREWVPANPPDAPIKFSDYVYGFNPVTHENIVLRQSGVPLAEALKAAGGLSPFDRGGVPLMRIDILSPLPTAPHDFNFSVPRASFVAVFSAAIQASFDLDIQKDTVQEEIFRLGKAPDGKEDSKPRQVVKESINDPAHGKMSVPSSTGGVSSNFIFLTQQAFGKKLVYDWSDGNLEHDGLAVAWDPAEGFDAFKNALRDQMGLQIKSDKLTIEVLHIRTNVKQ